MCKYLLFVFLVVCDKIILANKHYLFGSVVLFTDLLPFPVVEESNLGGNALRMNYFTHKIYSD